ncbi:MAG: AarF/ABC1/UbiB kinase family protein [Dehalococcoidia bacterium]|uniref:ABC1 kinase family protein n=1 Tax=Candidatus Amarobacter glycogenicus TaxID=3140699 RepID=UPI001D7FE8F7|nr:AarF/ABC1/UbiB kinase family protein [Dehalococcoidia bacterium]MBK8559769.1 AarF/ABC1/UbiB kinase family protein [Dehalococcoidia bacterium]
MGLRAGIEPLSDRAISGNRLSRSATPARLAGSAAARWAMAHVAIGEARERKKKRAILRTAEDVTRTMGEMKGAVMKVGQILSLMSGVLPEEMASQLAALQSSAPPMSYGLVHQVFEKEYGTGPERLFRSFDKAPFAAASIGQVHRAELTDGTPVAVKVQYPGVREAIDHDLANVGMMIKLGGLVARGLDAGTIVRDLEDGIRAELDYRREARWQQRFFEAFDGHAFVRVPRVYHELSSSTVLVQEFLRGQPFSAALELPQDERNRLGEMIYRFCFGSIYRHGLFNGDPHPGNFLLLEDGKIGFVDYGCVAEFDVPTIEGFKRLIRALNAGDRAEWRAATEAVGILLPGAPFTTDEVYDHMHWYWAPILDDEVEFTPELAAEMVRRNTMTTGIGGQVNRHCNVPAGMVFLTRINFGLAGLLAGLRAKGPWRAIVKEYVEGAAPSTELGRHSAASTRFGSPI